MFISLLIICSICFRYMAPELLDSNDRYPSADIFSLGLTLYEACISCNPQQRETVAAGNSPLPTEGPLWHVLRDGMAPHPPGRGSALCAVIHAAMCPEMSKRPLSETILSLPEVLKMSLQRGPNLLLDTEPKVSLPPTLARASSFLESMNTVERCSSLQLSEAGNCSASSTSRDMDMADDGRAQTPTGPTNSSGTISFWQPLPSRKWPSDKDKGYGYGYGHRQEKDIQGGSSLSMSSILEHTTPPATSSSYSTRNIDRKYMDCSTSRECNSSKTSNSDSNSTTFLFADSQSYYESGEWGSSPLAVSLCPGGARMGLRPEDTALSFPHPSSASSSRRRDRSYDSASNAPRSKSLSSFNQSSPAAFVCNSLSKSIPLLFSPIVSGGNSLNRTTPSPFSSTFPAFTPNIAKFRYTDSNINGSFTANSARGSISVGNIFCSAGLGGYCPGANSGIKEMDTTMRTVSKSIRRAGLETLTAGGERRNDKSA